MINEPDQMEEEEKELETEELEEKNHIQIRQIEEIEKQCEDIKLRSYMSRKKNSA
jgi:hypothetical protein